jgi:hypothetical protein
MLKQKMGKLESFLWGPRPAWLQEAAEHEARLRANPSHQALCREVAGEIRRQMLKVLLPVLLAMTVFLALVWSGENGGMFLGFNTWVWRNLLPKFPLALLAMGAFGALAFRTHLAWARGICVVVACVAMACVVPVTAVLAVALCQSFF